MLLFIQQKEFESPRVETADLAPHKGTATCDH